MKKRVIFLIIILAVFVGLLLNLLFHLMYFRNFHKGVMPATEEEKQKALEILNKTIDLSSYNIKFGNIYAFGHSQIILVELTNSTSKTSYFVDLTNEKVLKR